MAEPTNPNATKARKASDLVRARGSGVLVTLSRRMPGYPFGSVVEYALDEEGRPLFLLSSLALHTRNLARDDRASLLVFDPEEFDEPLAAARLNVMGPVRPVPPNETATSRSIYLERHPHSAEYLGFGDFAFYRLLLQDVYYIGGFGEMGWISPEDYAAARQAR